jgi:hypothetical protein
MAPPGNPSGQKGFRDKSAREEQLTADAPDGYGWLGATDLLGRGGAMLQNLEEAQKAGATSEPILSQDEILARAGVSIPTMRDIAPFQAVRLRPRWLAFLHRIMKID